MMMTSGRPFSPAANDMSLIPGFSGVLLLGGGLLCRPGADGESERLGLGAAPHATWTSPISFVDFLSVPEKRSSSATATVNRQLKPVTAAIRSARPIFSHSSPSRGHQTSTWFVIAVSPTRKRISANPRHPNTASERVHWYAGHPFSVEITRPTKVRSGN